MTHALLLTLLMGTPLPDGLSVVDPAALVKNADEAMLERLVESAWASLDTVGVQGHVTSRVKSAESLRAKMLRKGVGLSGIHDRLAVRVIVSDLESCYRVLEQLHGQHEVIHSELDDYIRDPKPSGYQSLHTAVRLQLPNGHTQTAEFQIRTYAMHAYAETGPAAHHRYKAGEFVA